MWSRRHGGRVWPGAWLRLRRLWQHSRLTSSSTTGWEPTTDERSASPTTSGSASPTTDAQHAPPTPNLARRLPWFSRWNPTPPPRRTRPSERPPAATAPWVDPPEQPASARDCPVDGWQRSTQPERDVSDPVMVA